MFFQHPMRLADTELSGFRKAQSSKNANNTIKASLNWDFFRCQLKYVHTLLLGWLLTGDLTNKDIKGASAKGFFQRPGALATPDTCVACRHECSLAHTDLSCLNGKQGKVTYCTVHCWPEMGSCYIRPSFGGLLNFQLNAKVSENCNKAICFLTC